MLDTAERLIVQEGYAAVSTRRVALEAGVNPPLVHYYFPTTEDLLLAVYARAAELTHERALAAFGSGAPLEAFWALNKDATHTSLGTEFYALANHRKMISSEIVRTGVGDRAAQAEALSQALGEKLDRSIGTPIGLIVLITAISRILVMEEGIGLTAGHDEARALVDWLLERAQQRDAAGKKAGQRRLDSPESAC